MKKRREIAKGLLLTIGHRKAGSFPDVDGNIIEYGEADRIVLLPIGYTNGTVKKYTIAEQAVKRFYAMTEDVSWGALIALEVEGSTAFEIHILVDPFSEDPLLDEQIEI